MMRIAVIEPVGGHGGMNFYDFGLCNGLCHAGAKVTLYSCDATTTPTHAAFEFRTPFKGIYGGAPKFLRAMRFMAGLTRALVHARWALRAEVVHFHFFHFTALERVCVSSAKMLGFLVVVTVHDVESFSGDFRSHLAKQVVAEADLLICHNEVSRREVEQKLEADPTRIRKISHGSYLDFVTKPPHQAECRVKLDLPEDAEVILFFGQIKKVKGLDLLLDAFAKIKDQRPNAVLLIAGKLWKDEAENYTTVIDRFGMRDRVRLVFRYIPDVDVPLYYGAADLVVLPYRRIYQSGVLLMAMSYGVPVVVSDLAGMREVVSGSNGYMFQAENVDDLSRAIVEALSSPATRRRVAACAMELMAREYAWDRIGTATLQAYQEAINRASGASAASRAN